MSYPALTALPSGSVNHEGLVGGSREMQGGWSLMAAACRAQHPRGRGMSA